MAKTINKSARVETAYGVTLAEPISLRPIRMKSLRKATLFLLMNSLMRLTLSAMSIREPECYGGAQRHRQTR